LEVEEEGKKFFSLNSKHQDNSVLKDVSFGSHHNLFLKPPPTSQVSAFISSDWMARLSDSLNGLIDSSSEIALLRETTGRWLLSTQFHEASEIVKETERRFAIIEIDMHN